MSSLHRVGERYELDWKHAWAGVVSAHLTRPAPSTHLDLAQETSVPLLARSRERFISGLLSIWAGGRPALLIPNEQLLHRMGRRAFEPQDTAPPNEGLPHLSFSTEDIIAEVLTSGSTGEPQTFRKRARQLFGEALTLVELLEWTYEDTVMATTASHHVYGLLFGVLAPWAAGAPIIAHEKNEPGAFHPNNVQTLAAKHSVTRLVTVPAHLHALLQERVQLPSVRQVITSAAPLDPRVATAFEDQFQVEVIDILGSTETGGIAVRRPARSLTWRPLPGVSPSLHSGGILALRSPFAEDPSRPQLTGERARLLPDGTFEYLGRDDGVVKVGGKRISLQEISAVAKKTPGVVDALALSRPVASLRGEEILLAVSGTNLQKDSLKRALRAELDPVFIPRRIRIVEELSVDERGKVKRQDALRLFEPPTPEPDEAAPREIPFRLPLDSRRFSGHFPNDPVLPALAQLLDFVLPEIRKHFGGGSLAELIRVKWTRPLRPGARLTLQLKRTRSGIRFEIREGSLSACTGTARLSESPDATDDP